MSKGPSTVRLNTPGGNGPCLNPRWAFPRWYRLLGTEGLGCFPYFTTAMRNAHQSRQQTRSHPRGVVWVPRRIGCNFYATAGRRSSMSSVADEVFLRYTLPLKQLWKEGRLGLCFLRAPLPRNPDSPKRENSATCAILTPEGMTLRQSGLIQYDFLIVSGEARKRGIKS
jgi:hypothetical protein